MIQQLMKDEGLQQALPASPPHALVVGRLGIVEALLGDLETVTHAGQRYTMAKIVGLLRDEVSDSAFRLSELERRSMKRSLDELAREQGRLLPDRIPFVARAQTIAESLSLC
jgi:hypothetical protein